MSKHPWHQVSVGDKAPEIVNAIIEIPRGSRVKYEIDKDSGLIKVDRILHVSAHYPANYGFIPQTYADDHDPLDILTICHADLLPGIIVESKILGMMEMIDKGETDHKLIAIAKDDPHLKHIDDMAQLPPLLLEEILDFFRTYKRLELKPGQTVEVKEFLPKSSALNTLEYCMKQYKKKFGDK